MNFVVTDGCTVVATRYISSRTSEASSLFFSSGTSFDEYQGSGRGLYRMTKADKRENIIMIASEPLTFERSDWMEVKTNTMMVITPKVRVSYTESWANNRCGQLTSLLFLDESASDPHH